MRYHGDGSRNLFAWAKPPAKKHFRNNRHGTPQVEQILPVLQRVYRDHDFRGQLPSQWREAPIQLPRTRLLRITADDKFPSRRIPKFVEEENIFDRFAALLRIRS